eukprot:scaffold604_cov384-Prasinococcus_capsulatus_cf.AAC.13
MTNGVRKSRRSNLSQGLDSSTGGSDVCRLPQTPQRKPSSSSVRKGRSTSNHRVSLPGTNASSQCGDSSAGKRKNPLGIATRYQGRISKIERPTHDPVKPSKSQSAYHTRQKGKLTDSTSAHNNTTLHAPKRSQGMSHCSGSDTEDGCRTPSMFRLQVFTMYPQAAEAKDECQSQLENMAMPTSDTHLAVTNPCSRNDVHTAGEGQGHTAATRAAGDAQCRLHDIENFFYEVEQKRLSDFKRRWNYDIAEDRPCTGRWKWEEM